MVRGGKKKRSNKTRKKNEDEVEYMGTVEPESIEPVGLQQDDNEKEDQQPVSQADPGQTSKRKLIDDEEPEGELELFKNKSHEEEPKRKRKRGPTRMNYINKDPNIKIRVEFTAMGEAYGDGSVKLSSYLGILAREHIPVTLERWPKLSAESKTLLMKSIEARFDIDANIHRRALFTQIGCLWRASKSRIVKEILKAENTQQRMNFRPANVSPFEWRRFVKQKTSPVIYHGFYWFSTMI